MTQPCQKHAAKNVAKFCANVFCHCFSSFQCHLFGPHFWPPLHQRSTRPGAFAHVGQARSISYTRSNQNKDVADRQGGTCVIAETNKQHCGTQQKWSMNIPHQSIIDKKCADKTTMMYLTAWDRNPTQGYFFTPIKKTGGKKCVFHLWREGRAVINRPLKQSELSHMSLW